MLQQKFFQKKSEKRDFTPKTEKKFSRIFWGYLYYMKFLDIIKESVFDNPIISIGVKTEGYVNNMIVVKYKVTDFDTEVDRVVVNDYYDFIDDEEITDPKGCIEDYFKRRKLNLGNSRVLKELIRLEPTEYRMFDRDENGRYYPEAFLGDYENYCGTNRDCQNKIIRTASRVLNIIYKSHYPITVYRGINPNEKFQNREHPGGYWSTKLSVAKSFGSIVYKGLIHNPEDIMLHHTMENRMRWPHEFELATHKVEVVEKYDFSQKNPDKGN